MDKSLKFTCKQNKELNEEAVMNMANRTIFPLSSLYKPFAGCNYDQLFAYIKHQREANPSIDIRKYENKKMDIDDLVCAPTLPPLFHIDYKGWVFDFLYKDCPSDSIYIVFSGAKINDNLPIFRRHSWSYFYDASVLYVADPMLRKYDELQLGWYLGTDTVDLYEYLRELLSIFLVREHKKEVICYGSSGGGYAALKFANYMDCCAIAINPQIYIKKYPYFAYFTKIVKDDFANIVAERINISINSSSKYFVVQNCTDRHDCMEHILPFFKTYGVQLKYGLSRNGNICSYIYHAYGGHDSQEDRNILTFILFFCHEVFSCDQDSPHFKQLDELAIALANVWALQRWYQIVADQQ